MIAYAAGERVLEKENLEMSKRVIKLAVAAVVLITSMGWAMTRMTYDKPTSPLKLTISSVPGADYNSAHIPLKVTFENLSNKPIRILNAFNDPKVQFIFFRLSIRSSDGTPIPPVGGGKVSLTKQSYQYVVLNKGEKTEVVFDAAAELSSGTKLRAGAYDFSVTYQNQYGDDCFQGKLDSNVVKITLAETP